MTEAVEFDVPDPGTPRLDGQEGDDQVQPGPDAAAGAATALMPVPGWTPQEAAQVVGGLVANLTLAMYAIRWQQAPAPALWPHIAGQPQQEFPLMGAGLAPVLDFIAPKGSVQAIGVSLTAGVGELIGAMARRWEVVNTAPPKAQGAGQPVAEQPAGPPASSEAGQGFHFKGEALHVLRRADDSPLVGLGL
jgi:hypothetical protein